MKIEYWILLLYAFVAIPGLSEEVGTGPISSVIELDEEKNLMKIKSSPKTLEKVLGTGDVAITYKEAHGIALKKFSEILGEANSKFPDSRFRLFGVKEVRLLEVEGGYPSWAFYIHYLYGGHESYPGDADGEGMVKIFVLMDGVVVPDIKR